MKSHLKPYCQGERGVSSNLPKNYTSKGAACRSHSNIHNSNSLSVITASFLHQHETGLQPTMFPHITWVVVITVVETKTTTKVIIPALLHHCFTWKALWNSFPAELCQLHTPWGRCRACMFQRMCSGVTVTWNASIWKDSSRTAGGSCGVEILSLLQPETGPPRL